MIQMARPFPTGKCAQAAYCEYQKIIAWGEFPVVILDGFIDQAVDLPGKFSTIFNQRLLCSDECQVFRL